MIYSPRAAPSVTKSRTHTGSRNNLLIYHMGEVYTHLTNKGFCSIHSWVYLHGVSNRIKRADSMHCCFHLVRFPNARRFHLSRDTVDCQINIPISIY